MAYNLGLQEVRAAAQISEVPLPQNRSNLRLLLPGLINHLGSAARRPNFSAPRPDPFTVQGVPPSKTFNPTSYSTYSEFSNAVDARYMEVSFCQTLHADGCMAILLDRA